MSIRNALVAVVALVFLGFAACCTPGGGSSTTGAKASGDGDNKARAPGEETTGGRDAGPRDLVLFIHGITGSNESWRAKGAKDSFSDLIGSDDALGRPMVKHLQYASSIWKGGQPLSQIADSMAGEARDFIDSPSVRDVFIVGHSMGGLIAQHILVREYLKTDKNKIRAVILLACPSAGTDFAEAFPILTGYAVEDLRNLHINSFINALQGDMDILVKKRENNKWANPQIFAACETQKTPIRVLRDRLVVTQKDAMVVGAFPMPIEGKHHTNIATPESGRDDKEIS